MKSSGENVGRKCGRKHGRALLRRYGMGVWGKECSVQNGYQGDETEKKLIYTKGLGYGR